MEFVYTRTAIIFVLCACFVHTAIGMPRTVAQSDEVVPLESSGVVQFEKSTTQESIPKVLIPGRVSCRFEDPTEDVVCQEHCLPKGYSYGVCVSHTCTCV